MKCLYSVLFFVCSIQAMYAMDYQSCSDTSRLDTLQTTNGDVQISRNTLLGLSNVRELARLQQQEVGRSMRVVLNSIDARTCQLLCGVGVDGFEQQERPRLLELLGAASYLGARETIGRIQKLLLTQSAMTDRKATQEMINGMVVCGVMQVAFEREKITQLTG